MRRELMFVLALVAGCGKAPCARHSDCAFDEQCSPQRVCIVPLVDAGIDDAPNEEVLIDAAPEDAAVDAAIDAPVDAPVDAAVDAGVDAPADGGP